MTDSEVEDDAGGDAQIILILRSEAQFVEMSQKVFHLNWPDRKAVRKLHIHSAAHGHCKGVVGAGKSEPVITANVSHAEKHLSKRRDARITAVRNPRAEKISGKC